jgi:hypothetical protein
VPAHLPLITDDVDATVPVGGASHVNVIGGGGPLAVTDAAPVQVPLHTMFVMVGVMVMEVGWVILNVCVRTQFRLSVTVTVWLPAQSEVAPAAVLADPLHE